MTGDRASARAVWFTGPEQVELRREDVPPPGEGEVTVEAHMSLISPGTEASYYKGRVPAGLDVGLPTVESGPEKFPIKFGYSAVGRVRAAGPGVEHLLDRVVFARHPHQEGFTLPVEYNGRPLVRTVPDTVEPEVASFMNLVEVAHNALLDVHVVIGDVVVVFGCGIVGLCIAELAGRTASVVVAVDPVPERRKLAIDVGIDVAVSPDEVEEVVASYTEGRLADVAFEVTGSPAALQQALNVTTVQGTVAVASFYGERTTTLDLGTEFHTRAQRIVSTMVGRLNPALGPRWDMARRGRYAAELLNQLNLKRMITHRFPIEEAIDAFAIAADPGRGGLAVLIEYPRSEEAST